ncbi:DUF5134 domain-containing protein [Dactylosporangium sp. CA-092794]|uniref:DUF5134 domain-containing protein n=1 Tax=Dactylosporangium sp. CA-092794 TaxID=3239929 RepID=UPI003D946BCA
MAGSEAMVRIALVTTFAVAGLYCLPRCLRSRHPWPARLADLLHGAMCAVMVAMLFGIAGDPWGVQLTVFAVAAGWHVVRLVAAAPGGHPDRWSSLTQAIMMSSMCWMLLPGPHGAAAPMPGAHLPGPDRAEFGPAVTGTLAVALIAASVLWTTRSFALANRPARRGGVTAPGYQAAMAAAMGASLIVMLPM